eukprot:TRINITY_DN11008_c0_g1_i1.p1 TRINITY_DN11008_c0_g1~~TRINITY_DN11008_c0_g1_i1.p1  ORF type:complete len:160 (+),score=13.56 TRINITY_DN11008_c0_g1_i1:69-548(+)
MERYDCSFSKNSATISPPKIPSKRHKRRSLLPGAKSVEGKCLAKKFMYDASVFTYSDPTEPNRGPGSYELPSLVCNAKKRQGNVSKSPQRPVPYSYSPGVCYYRPNADTVLRRSPNFAEQRENRFKWQCDVNKIHLPLNYEFDMSTKLKRHGVILMLAL